MSSISNAKEIGADLSDPAKGHANLRARAEELRQLWFDSFVAAGVSSKKEELRQALNEGKWSEAVDLAANSLASAGMRMGNGGAAAAPPPPSDSANRLTIDSDRILGAFAARSKSVELPPLEGSAREHIALYRFIKTSAAVQSIFFAILFIVGVYVFYADAPCRHQSGDFGDISVGVWRRPDERTRAGLAEESEGWLNEEACSVPIAKPLVNRQLYLYFSPDQYHMISAWRSGR